MQNVRIVTFTHDEHEATLTLLQNIRDTIQRVVTGPDAARFSREELDAKVAKMVTLTTAIIAMKDAR